MYRRVYPEFLQLVGQDDELIRQSQDIFDHMLGYQKGRVYYQLQNWYKLIQLLPGYSYNKEFFDRMLMPVRTEKVIATHANRGVVAMIKKWLYVFRFVALLLRTDSLCASFTAAYEQKRKHYNSISWETCNGRTLSKLYERITSDYLHHWSIPILNDFRVMIYHGIFQKILYRYATHEVYLQLLGNIKNVASIRPIHDLDTIYKSIHALWESECDFDRIYKIMTTCRSTEAVRRLISEYKKKHGVRTPDELKLENPRLIQDEKLFLTYLIYAARQYTPSNEQKPFANYSKNSLPILVRLVLHPITRQLRSAIAQREKFRFYRAEVFGMARTVFLTGAQRLLDEGLIRDIQDVFYLTKQELFDILNGHDSLYDAKHRVDERKKRFCIYAKDQPARRLTSHGVVPAVHTINDMPSDDATSVPTGLGVSPGVSTASVVVMDTFDPMVDLTGKILITHHTDPGWTLLFLKIKGVVVERGNALSHASIIARELHIPAIVSVPHIVSLIKTGDVIRINGTTGTIDILSSA
jgi:pyruvate,water dikinase